MKVIEPLLTSICKDIIDCMIPVDEGYGDYIDMNVRSDGSIEGWSCSDFEEWMVLFNGGEES